MGSTRPPGRPARYGKTDLVAMRIPHNIVLFLEDHPDGKVHRLVEVITHSREYQVFLEQQRQKRTRKKKRTRGTK